MRNRIAARKSSPYRLTVVLRPGIRRARFNYKSNGLQITVNRTEWGRLSAMGEGDPARGSVAILTAAMTTANLRFAELSAALDLPPHDGAAQQFLDGVISQIMEGDHGVILDGWDFKQGEKWARVRIAALVKKWKFEDAGKRSMLPAFVS